MGVQSCFKAIGRGSTDHLSWESIPGIDGADPKSLSANSGVSSWFLDLERMSSGSGVHVTDKKLGRIQFHSRVEDLVQPDHVSTTAPVVQRGDLELLEAFTVGQVSDVPYESGGTPLNLLQKPLVRSVKGSPCQIPVFKVRTH